jgi:hypothetical protein
MAKVFKSRFSKWFVKELIKAFDGEHDVVVITFDEHDDNGHPHQKFYSADNVDLAVMHKTATVDIRPYEEYWIERHKNKIEIELLKKPEENTSGN